MNRRIAVCAAALGATLLVSPSALAGVQDGKQKPTTIELSRPSDGPDGDAQGTVRIEHGKKGDQTVLQLSHLDPRTVYEVRDTATGDTVGEVKTNRRGRANFNLTKRLAKAASSDGADANGVDDVEIVDPATGDCVLEGGVVADPCEGLEAGYADYSNEAGDAASVFMESAPGFGSESFSMTFFPVRESFAAEFYDFYRDTAFGDTLPLGVDSVGELAGREFQIVAPDGTVVIDDVLPDLEAEECYSIDDPSEGDGTWDWSGGFPGGVDFPDGFDFSDGFDWTGGFDPSGSYDGSDDESGSDGSYENARHGRQKKARRGGVKDDPGTDPVEGYTLRIEDENGDLVDAGVLEQQLYDQPIDCPWLDTGDGSGDGSFGGGFGGIFIGIVIIPFDGSFDLQGLLDQILGGLGGDSSGSSDANDLADFFRGGTKHGNR